MKTLAITLCALTFAASALAASAKPRPRKPVVCENFSIATLQDGGKLGLCSPTKPGGRMTEIRSFQIVNLIDPAAPSSAVRVMVGFR